MGELKRHQPPMTIEEQIANLKAIGLIIEDEEYAKRILNDISYFRLIKAYSLNLKEKNGNYHKSVTFNHILELYLFNSNFRQILFPQIEKIEVNIRCRIANYFANSYGVLGYKNSSNFANEEYHKVFLQVVNEGIRRNSETPFVKNFMNNYEGKELPIYALVEIISFGTISKFYKNMKNYDKKIIAKSFGVNYLFLESWIESISYIRNICTHYGRLYNAKLSKRPIMYKEYSEAGISNDRIFGVLICMKQLLNKDLRWNLFVDEIELLLEKHDGIDIKTMGFIDNWKNILESKENHL